MQLTGETRLSSVLENIPGALDYVVALNPHDFWRLRNPFMREYMSPRISLSRVAAMAGVPQDTLLRELAALSGGAAEAVMSAAPSAALPRSPSAEPPWLAEIDLGRLHWVDVLPIDDVLGDPILPINLAVRRLALGVVVGIRHKWEPQPLYDIWQKMGLQWFARQVGPEEWQVFVHRPPTAPAPKPETGATTDLRGLPQGEPVPRATAMFEQLGIGEHLDLWVDSPRLADEVRTALGRKHAGRYRWEEQHARPDKPSIRVVRIG